MNTIVIVGGVDWISMDPIILHLEGGGREGWASELGGVGGGCGYIWVTWLAVAFILLCYGTRRLLNNSLPWKRQSERQISSEYNGKSSVVRGEALSTRNSLDGQILQNAQRISEHFSEMHLQMLLNELEERFDREELWKTVIEKKNDSVSYHAKCCDPKDGGPTKYISTTTFENCTTELLRDFYMDNEFRKEWDKTVVEHDQLEIDQENGIEIGRTIKKFPFLTAREYVLAWRVWEGKEKGFYCLIKACGHPLAAKQSKYIRVDFYFSGWHIRKVQGRDACEIKMVHQEDIGLNREMAKTVFKKGIWSYVCKMEANLRKYARRTKLNYNNQPSAVTLMQNVPRGVQETWGDVRGPIEDSIVGSITASKEEIQKKGKLTANQSKTKLLAKGLLLLGGAICIRRGYSSLGAKLAVACVINKLVKKHGVSRNIVQKQLLLRPPVADR